MKGRKTTKFAVVEQQRWNRAVNTEGGKGAAAAPPPPPILAGQVTLFQSGEKSMSTPLLLAPPDFLTFLRPWQRWKGKPDSCLLASRHDFEYSSVTSHDDIAIHSLQEVYLQGNTTYIQGDLTPNFPTFSKRILNLDFYINADPGST